jgi:glycosyltransferase involved in cell wall biosynthesis
MRVSIIIPAYQEERTIADVVRLVRGVDLSPLEIEKEIVIVDDGSRDATSDQARRAAEGDRAVQLYRHPENRGKGAAIRTGLAAATGEVCLIQDADLEYSVEDYQAILSPMVDGAPVVYGSRFLKRRWPEGMHVANYVANRLLTLMSNVLYPHHITDEATCLKAIRTELLRSLDLECTRFEFCPEVTAKLGLKRVPIVEVPVRYTGRDLAAGKKVGWRDGVEAFGVLLKYRLRNGQARPPER